MAQRREEERLRKAALSRLDNEDCDEEEEEEEEDLTDEEEVGGCLCVLLSSLLLLVLGLKLTSALCQNVEELLGGDGEVEEDGDEEGASLAQSTRSLSPVVLNRPPSTPDLVNTDGTLMLFPGNSCSHTAYVCGWMVQSLYLLYDVCVFMCVLSF